MQGVSLDVMPGDFFALLGPNGAGKTTLIGAVCGIGLAVAVLSSALPYSLEMAALARLPRRDAHRREQRQQERQRGQERRPPCGQADDGPRESARLPMTPVSIKTCGKGQVRGPE